MAVLGQVLLLLAPFSAVHASTAPPTPVWPQTFVATMVQNRSGDLALVTLVYDWPGGRNLNLIQKQTGGGIWDLEWTNGTSFYYNLTANTCRTRNFTVGILTPDWLAHATYLGIEMVDNRKCHKWTKSEFIDYWADVESGVPIRWIFLWDGAVFDILQYHPDIVPPDPFWQAPPSCFSDNVEANTGATQFSDYVHQTLANVISENIVALNGYQTASNEQ